jgi:hypothetical protein
MNEEQLPNGFQLLRGQFDRLARNPSDTRLLAQLSAELGATLTHAYLSDNPQRIREYRVLAAGALKAIQGQRSEAASRAATAIDALLTVSDVAETGLSNEIERRAVNLE